MAHRYNSDAVYKLDENKQEFEPSVVGRDPLTAWKHYFFQKGALPIEYLVPRAITASQREFDFITLPLAIPPAEAQRKMTELYPWTYHVEVPGASTRGHGTYNEGTIRFHRYRANLICDPIARMLGDDLPRSTFLDIGCNCGFFTFEMAARGAKYALGLDLRNENIDQAEFLKLAFGLKNVEFGIKNIKSLASNNEQFDVVLNLGLMYHLSTPYEVMKACFDICREFCVVDTITHTEPFSGFHLLRKDATVSIEGDLSFELQPTYRGILDTIFSAGFPEVLEIIAPTCDVELYNSGSRRCLIAFKSEASRYINRLIA